MPKTACLGLATLFTLVLLATCPSLALSEAPLENGLYTIGVVSSSDKFNVTQCMVRVDEGEMTGMLTLGGTGYRYLYAGTGGEAAKAPESDWIPFAEGFEGEYVYTMPIPELDAEIPVAAYSKRKESWYDRTLTFTSKTLAPHQSVAPDGNFRIVAQSDAEQLSRVDCALSAQNGAMTAQIPVTDDAITSFDLGAGEISVADGKASLPVDSLDVKIPFKMCVNGAWEEHWLLLESSQAQTLNVTAKDGVYTLDVKSDSGLFRVKACEVTVDGGHMRARLTAQNANYDLLYVGPAADALNAADAWIPAIKGADGAHSFVMDLQTLDNPVSVATHSPSKDMWYDRTLKFLSETMAPIEGAPERGDAQGGSPIADGEYVPDAFTHSGGSGKVALSCEKVSVSGGEAVATIAFSSAKYTQVTVEGVAYAATTDGERALFEIPVKLGADTEIIGTTTAMSKPTDIAYVIRVELNAVKAPARQGAAPDIPGLNYASAMALSYAECFQIYRYEGGYSLIDVRDSARYLVVPEGGQMPTALPEDVIALEKPIKNIYLAATSAMALFDALDALDRIRLTGVPASGWYIDNAAEAMERNDILFAGKYSEPDFELLLRENCGLAIESTMILHSPNVKEMIELLGIPVFIDRSSYEMEPLGRTEWIKLYGVLVGKEKEAEAFFDRQALILDQPGGFESTGKTVAFFYISSDGSVVVRNSFDYVTKMIELAGGVNAFAGVVDKGETRSSVSISMEDFYAAAVDADYLVYNATVDAPVSSVEELLAKGGGTLHDFKAVREGNLWCASKYLYQATDTVGYLIGDFRDMLTGADDGMTFLYKVN